MKKIFIGTLCFTMLSLYSCKKDETTTPNPTPTNNSGTNINIEIKDGEISPTDGNGSFAVNHSVISYINVDGSVLMDFDSYTAFGAFYNGVPATTYLDGGDVILNSTDTLSNFMGVYSLSSTSNFIQGGNTWTITGNSATSIPPFTYSAGNSFPSFQLWNTSYSYNKSQGISITLPADITSADTAIFIISSNADQTKRVQKLVSTKSRTFSFSQAELSTLPTGDINIQLTAMKMFVNVSGGKKYYFFNQYQRGANARLN